MEAYDSGEESSDDDGTEIIGGGEDETSAGDDALAQYHAQITLYEVASSIGDIEVRASSGIRRLNEGELGFLFQLADHKAVECMRIFGRRPDMLAVRKAAFVVSRVEGLRDLCLDVGKPPFDSPGPFIDVLLNSMTSHSRAKLRRLELSASGRCPDTWRRFMDRFAPDIEALSVGNHNSERMTTELARSLPSRFPKLQEFKLECTVQENNAESANVLLRALPNVSALKDLSLVVSGTRRDPRDTEPVMHELSSAAEVALLCRSLESLSVSMYDKSLLHMDRIEVINRMCDGSFLLERVLKSQSLKEVNLQGFVLMNSSDRTLQHRQVNVVNQSVETLRLMQCALGEEKSLISCFKGVKSVDLFNVTILRRPGVPPANRLLASIEGLESFSYREDVVHWNEPIIGEQMAWISSNISAAPSLRSMDLQLKREHLPYLPSVLVDCPPKLCMQINAGEDVSQLCAGIEAAQSLTSLNLALEDSQISQPSFHSILGSVSNHPGIRHFAFVFRIHLFSWVELEQFLSNNTSVENFELDPTGGDLEPGHVGFKSVIQGLRRNRNLQSITFLVPEFESQNDYVRSYPGEVPVTAEMSELIVSMLEECNTSLKSIEGPFYESRQHEGRIHSLLELNRHGQEFVANLRSVPLGLWGAVVPMDRWGDVFSRISNTDCNFFVTKLVRQAMCGDQMEPRGIGAGDPNSGTNARTN